MQHEAVHGHPTPSRFINALLVFPAIGFVTPYLRYAREHRRHHATPDLTHPLFDPESFYETPEKWRSRSKPIRLLLLAHNSLAGRLLIGPWLYAVRFWANDLAALLRGDRHVAMAWICHGAGLWLVFYWLAAYTELPVAVYLLGGVYPGLALTMLRSFAEHRAHESVTGRTALVPSNPLFSLLFLNNNLHSAHHEAPGLPWYDLPGYARRNWDRLVKANGGYVVNGYRQLAHKHGLVAKEPVVHPQIGQ